jgi:hypothetical protein
MLSQKCPPGAELWAPQERGTRKLFSRCHKSHTRAKYEQATLKDVGIDQKTLKNYGFCKYPKPSPKHAPGSGLSSEEPTSSSIHVQTEPASSWGITSVCIYIYTHIMSYDLDLRKECPSSCDYNVKGKDEHIILPFNEPYIILQHLSRKKLTSTEDFRPGKLANVKLWLICVCRIHVLDQTY